jgi:hypothetical protein
LGKNKKYEFTNSVKSMFELKKKIFTTASKHCICTWRTSMLLKVWLSFLGSKYSKECVFENFKEWIKRDHAVVRGINKHLISSFLSFS